MGHRVLSWVKKGKGDNNNQNGEKEEGEKDDNRMNETREEGHRPALSKD